MSKVQTQPMAAAETPPPLLPEPVQCFILNAFGAYDAELGRDLLLSLARRVVYAREVHPRFGGMDSVQDEFAELKRAHGAFEVYGDPRRMREEALDVMATCIRLINLEMPPDDEEDGAPAPQPEPSRDRRRHEV